MLIQTPARLRSATRSSAFSQSETIDLAQALAIWLQLSKVRRQKLTQNNDPFGSFG